MADSLLASLRRANKTSSKRPKKLAADVELSRIEAGQKRTLEREIEFQDSYDRGTLPSSGAVLNGFNLALETLLPAFKANFPGVAVATLNGRLVYREGTNMVSGNWRLLRSQLGKSSSFYFNPWWGIVTNYNKLEGGVVSFARREAKGVTDQDVMIRSQKNAGKGRASYVKRQEKYFRGNATALAERIARLEGLNNRVSMRSQYLRSLVS